MKPAKRHYILDDAKALYTIADLVHLAGGNVSKNQMRLLLKSHGIVPIRAGRAHYVPINEIMHKMPQLWHAIETRLSHVSVKKKSRS